MSRWLGKQQATLSIGKIPIKKRGQNGGEGGPPYFNGKGGRFTAVPLQLPFAQHDHKRRQRIAGGRNEPCPDRND